MSLIESSIIQTSNSLRELRAQYGVSSRRLSSGQQLTKAADNPAALAIAKSLMTELRSQTQATRNINDGLSLVRTAEGGLSDIQDQLGRLRELGVQGSSSTLSDAQRSALNEESNAILQEITRVANVTSFNDQSLLNGGLSTALNVQAGTGSGAENTIAVEIQDSRAAALGLSSMDNLSTATSSQSFLAQVDDAISSLNERRSQIGVVENRLSSAGSSLAESQIATASAYSTISDTDYAAETSRLTRNQILQQSAISVLAQSSGLGSGLLELIG